MNRNAIIMAAGMSTRFLPLSLEIPKPLLKVKGEILIERQIRQLRDAGIQEIVIVVGYLKEKFEYLKEKYGVILIENPYYQKKNNHSTLYVAKDYLENTFICSGDNYFVENVFMEESQHAYYASVFEAGQTNEWCLHVDESGNIKKVEVGGSDSWIMKGHAFFNKEFSKAIVPYICEAFHDEQKKDAFWEDVFVEHIEEMDMYIHRYADGIIEEFDSIEELKKFDKGYESNSGSKVMKSLCEQLKCEEQEITDIHPYKIDGQVEGFQFNCKAKTYMYCLKAGLLEE